MIKHVLLFTLFFFHFKRKVNESILLDATHAHNVIHQLVEKRPKKTKKQPKTDGLTRHWTIWLKKYSKKNKFFFFLWNWWLVCVSPRRFFLFLLINKRNGYTLTWQHCGNYKSLTIFLLYFPFLWKIVHHHGRRINNFCLLFFEKKKKNIRLSLKK